MISRAPPAHAVTLLLAPLLALSGGCGGGSTQDAPISMRFTPTSLSSSFLQGDGVSAVQVIASVDRAPGGDVFVGVLEDAPVLAPSIHIAGNTSLSFQGFVSPLCTLVPGIHEGTITVILCKDAACASRYPVTGNTLAYRFTVAPGPMLTLAVDGATLPGALSHCSTITPNPSVHAGQTVTLTSGIPVTWTTEILTSFGVPSVSGVSSTATTWSGVLGSASGSGRIGSVRIRATPTVATVSPWNSADINVTVP